MSRFLLSFSAQTLRSLLVLSESREGRLCVNLSSSSTRHSSLATRHFPRPIAHARAY